MRARLALDVSGSVVTLREVRLRAKPQAFLDISPSATVPCLQTAQGVIDESLDIMLWALARHDPEGWLVMPDAGQDWIARADGPFKSALDRTKYPNRHPGSDPLAARAQAAAFLGDLDAALDDWIFDAPSLADMAILPFVRQFAMIDRAWFDAQPWPDLRRWLDRFLASPALARIMVRLDPWAPGDPPVQFP